MPDPGDTQTVAPEPSARTPRRGWRLLLRSVGWLVFFLVVTSISYILLVLAGH
ncbi:MAG TPA: hypothetical protein VGI00_15325 [Streptosporangiaceae bacterium]|jgi:hypothetical protein